MKKWIGVMICVIFLIGLCGCISQDEYDKVTAERDDLNAKVTELQKEYADLVSKNTDLDEKLKESQKKVEELTEANEKLKTENESIIQALEEAKNSKGSISGLWDSIMSSFDSED